MTDCETQMAFPASAHSALPTSSPGQETLAYMVSGPSELTDLLGGVGRVGQGDQQHCKNTHMKKLQTKC